MRELVAAMRGDLAQCCHTVSTFLEPSKQRLRRLSRRLNWQVIYLFVFLISVIFKLKKEKHAVDLIINHYEHDTKVKIHLFFFCVFLFVGRHADIKHI